MNDRDWVCGYLEGRISFSVVFNLLETKNRKFLVLKPYINIQNSSLEQMNKIRDILGIENTKQRVSKKEGKDLFNLAVQNYDDIRSIIKIIGNYDFISKKKNDTYRYFIMTFNKIDDLEEKSFSEWDDAFLEIIENKCKINPNSKGFDEIYWKKKIRKYFK